MKKIMKLINHFIYIRLYHPKKHRIQNKLLVIGLFRKFFKFKYFTYINIK